MTQVTWSQGEEPYRDGNARMGPLQEQEGILTACGAVGLSDVVREGARLLAVNDYSRARDDEFSGEEVRDIVLPWWLGDAALLLPVASLKTLGLKLRDAASARLYATCGVDEHIDDITGLSVAVVLHSDGFVFKSPALSLTLKTGGWFIFDDRLAHEVLESEDSTTLLVLVCPLETA